MRKFLFTVVLYLIVTNSQSQDLPHYMSENEKKIYNNYQPPFIPTDFTNPPPGSVRTMAEWEEVRGIIITWTSYTSILRQIIDYAQDEGLVYIVCSDSNAVRTSLTNNGIPLTNLKFIIAPFNSVWCRDYGPWAVYSGISDSLKLIDWIYNRPRPSDDNVPVSFANFINAPIYQTTVPPYNLIATGGNFMVDGNGTGFSSKLILNENPALTESQIDNIMNLYMGINRYIKMQTLPYDQIHHIDMHMKLLDEETLLIGQYPAGTADGPQIEANLQYITNNFQTCYGRPYKVIRIPMPPSLSGQYPPSANYYTYTNSVFINKTVLVPVYGLSQDTTALRIYRENLPGYRIVGINCSSMISALGAIHCITKEIGVAEQIFISHAKHLNTYNTSDPYEVKSYIKTRSGIASAKVFWRIDTTQLYNEINMINTLDTFRALIPAQVLGTNIYYYISAESNSGKAITKPITAPGGYLKFAVDNSYLTFATYNVKVAVEGLYDPIQNKLFKKDYVSAVLRNSTPPYQVIDSASAVIDSNSFAGSFLFYTAPSNKYYLVMKYKSSVETWSRENGDTVITGSNNNYDFTTSASQAYGSNMKLKGFVYCIYSGDVNGDNFADLSDMIAAENDASNYVNGNAVTDLNGDRVVDLIDLSIIDNNLFNYVQTIRP
ncbi:MAG: agmatine deiminase family protein [bacterium]